MLGGGKRNSIDFSKRGVLLQNMLPLLEQSYTLLCQCIWEVDLPRKIRNFKVIMT